MNQRLCPWEEKKYKISKNIDKNSREKTKKAKKENYKPYFKNLSNAQQYNIYPVKKPIFPTPVKFLFIGDEEFQNLLNDIFRDDADYLFLPNYIRYILSKYFFKWKNKIQFHTIQKKQCKKKQNINKQYKPKKCDYSAKPISSKSNENFIQKQKWMNDDYEISPITIEYYSQKRLKPTKTSDRLFNSSLTQSRIGDFQKDKIWQKIIHHY